MEGFDNLRVNLNEISYKPVKNRSEAPVFELLTRIKKADRIKHQDEQIEKGTV